VGPTCHIRHLHPPSAGNSICRHLHPLIAPLLPLRARLGRRRQLCQSIPTLCVAAGRELRLPRATPNRGSRAPPATGASSARPWAACSAWPRPACRLPRSPPPPPPFIVASSSSSATATLMDRERRGTDGRETRGKQRGESGAEPLRPSNFEGRSQPGSKGNTPPGAALLPPLPIQTPAGADPLRSALLQRFSNQKDG
jgi:hypothetical protein